MPRAENFRQPTQGQKQSMSFGGSSSNHPKTADALWSANNRAARRAAAKQKKKEEK